MCDDASLVSGQKVLSAPSSKAGIFFLRTAQNIVRGVALFFEQTQTDAMGSVSATLHGV
jgi:hypothetical protein